ncbi:MAG: DUF3833 family protein [Maricaulaceae bacterium]
MFLRLLVLGGAAAIALSACATRPPIPRNPAPQGGFVVERDLAGKRTGRGEFSAINGVKRGFSVALNGIWDGQTLTLVEDYAYDDGETDTKTWTLTRIADGEWRGTREDVVGEARGFLDGDAFRLEYQVVLPSEDGDGGRQVGFRDVLIKSGPDTVYNFARVGWLGLRVGQVELEIGPADAG